VVWLCPTPDDDKPERFRVLLTSALGVRPDLLAPDGGGPAARPIDLVQWLRGQLTDGQAPVVLAIDDAHILTDPQILDLLDKIAGHGHPRLHLVLAARHDPPLPLHRYRLAGQMYELRAPDLAMTLAELHQVLAAHQVTLPMSALRTVAAQTEGWAAGVRLAAMRLEHASRSFALTDEPSFDYGSIGEYFAAEVLGHLPEPHRRLLVETSFLDEVTAPLARAITGLDGAGELLADLAPGNWFVIALDPGRTRFRYHRLFAAVLRDLLRRDSQHTMPELADRAAACFERAGDMEQALYWAARAGNPHRAAAMLVRGGLSHAFAHHNSIPEAELAGVLPTAVRSGGAERRRRQGDFRMRAGDDALSGRSGGAGAHAPTGRHHRRSAATGNDANDLRPRRTHAGHASR
jgi:LuxR family transcriptional regulator, maltose regulon positive regulatory protein